MSRAPGVAEPAASGKSADTTQAGTAGNQSGAAGVTASRGATRPAAAQAAAPVVLFAVGAFGVLSALRYGLWDVGGPGAGLLPGLASVGLCLFAAIAVCERQLRGEPPHLPRLAGYVAGLIGFALLMGPLGAVPAIVVLFCWTLGVVERWSWRRVAPIAVGAALFAWVLFERLLQVPLPGGILG